MCCDVLQKQNLKPQPSDFVPRAVTPEDSSPTKLVFSTIVRNT